MRKWICRISIVLFGTFWIAGSGRAQEQPAMSRASQACLSCHGFYHPGIKSDWGRSRHAKVTPAEALAKKKLNRRISNEKVPDALLKIVIGSRSVIPSILKNIRILLSTTATRFMSSSLPPIVRPVISSKWNSTVGVSWLTPMST
jgi:hypothetical protein